MKKFLGLAVALIALSSSASHALYTNNVWMQTWDFNDGTQGFISSNGSLAYHDATTGGGSLATYDTGYFYLPISFAFGASYNKGFVLQADVLFLAGNTIQGQNIAMKRAGDLKGPAVGGGSGSNYAYQAKDRTWDNTNRSRNYVFGKGSPAVNTWFKVQLDYGYTVPGKWSTHIWSPIDTDRQLANTWYLGHENLNVNGDPLTTFIQLAVGGSGDNGITGWGQSRWDNLKIVPEPGSIVALGSGLIGMAGVVIRRKK